MRFALGMDNREIARALGRSDGATKVLIHRAIKQLEEIVGDRGEWQRPRRGRCREERPMSEAASNFEGLLREALAPVEPPEDLVERLESTLTSITEMAADELEAWELSAMRDPRNWVRPAAALVVGRRRRRRRSCCCAPAGARRRPRARPAPARARPPSARCATSAARRAGCSATAERSRRGAAALPAEAPRPQLGCLPRHGHLLPPPLARDRRLLLELRAADLPRLHDHHAGRHALPGVRQPAHQGRCACATWPPCRRSPTR